MNRRMNGDIFLGRDTGNEFPFLYPLATAKAFVHGRPHKGVDSGGY